MCVDLKHAQCESCKLSFIWGTMRTAAWEIAPQIALRNCSEEVVGESQYMWFWWRGSSCTQALIFPEAFYESPEAFAGHKKQSSSWRILTNKVKTTLSKYRMHSVLNHGNRITFSGKICEWSTGVFTEAAPRVSKKCMNWSLRTGTHVNNCYTYT